MRLRSRFSTFVFNSYYEGTNKNVENVRKVVKPHIVVVYVTLCVSLKNQQGSGFY